VTTADRRSAADPRSVNGSYLTESWTARTDSVRLQTIAEGQSCGGGIILSLVLTHSETRLSVALSAHAHYDINVEKAKYLMVLK